MLKESSSFVQDGAKYKAWEFGLPGDRPSRSSGKKLLVVPKVQASMANIGASQEAPKLAGGIRRGPQEMQPVYRPLPKTARITQKPFVK